MNFCSECGTKLEEGMNYCGNCGSKVAHIEPTIPDKPSPPVVRSSEDTLNCPECEQTLSVKMEIRPVMSRCPLCKIEFMAMGIIEKEEKGLFDGQNGKRNKAIALGLIVLFVGLIIINQDDETVDLYVTYGAYCEDCGYVSADIDLPTGGSTDSVIGFPDADGYVFWEYSFSIKEDALDESLRAYIIASHEEGSDTFFSTFILVDDFPWEAGSDEACVLDSDMVVSSSSGSGGYCTYESFVNNC